MKQKTCMAAMAFAAMWAPAAAPAQAPAAPQKPKLVLAIVIDQFRYDYLTRFRNSYTAGLKRLLEGGAVYTQARYPQAPTVTAVGHTTFLSGAVPAVSGIIGNEWYDRATHDTVTSVSDPGTRLIGGAPGATGSSPRRLLVSTFPDELKIAGQGVKVIGLSLKDRSAILPVGHMADAAYWFDPDSNHWVTSDYYRPDLPAWVQAINDSRPVAGYLGASWVALGAPAGAAPYCTLVNGGDIPYCGSIEATPFGNEILEEFAEQAIVQEQLGQHEGTDVLALSFSSNDYAGHALGPDHPAIKDISIRTDRLIGKLLDLLDRRLGQGETLVVLTADHGVAPVPEVNEARKMPAGRLDALAYPRAVSQALSARYGEAQWLEPYQGGIYLNRKTLEMKKVSTEGAAMIAAEALRQLPHTARAYTAAQLQAAAGAGDPLARAMALGDYAPRAADLFVLAEPYYLTGGSGTTHSTPYSYDNHVPVIFYGPGVRPGLYRRPILVNDIAPTLAEYFSVETPSGAYGQPLSEIVP